MAVEVAPRETIRSVFVRRPVLFTFNVEGEGARTVSITRVPARHAFDWEQVWSEYNPTLKEYTHAQINDLTVRIVKAGIPEPDATCPITCPCGSNANDAGRRGVHALIDRLGREEIDTLFQAVLEANAPKGGATAGSRENTAGSASTRRSPVEFWLDFLFSRHSRSRSRSSATSS